MKLLETLRGKDTRSVHVQSKNDVAKVFFNHRSRGRIKEDSPKVVTVPFEQVYQEVMGYSEKELIALRKRASTAPIPNEKEILTLSDLGFKGMEVVKKADTKMRVNRNRQNDLNDFIDEMMKAEEKFPGYRYISEEGLQTVCKKYNLIEGDFSQYTGQMPKKNLQELLEFKKKYTDHIEPTDQQYIDIAIKWSKSYLGRDMVHHGDFHIKNRSEEGVTVGFTYTDHRFRTHEQRECTYEVTKESARMLGYSIAAPISEMGNKIKPNVVNRQILNVDDPIITYECGKGKVIATAWGPEAEDEMIK